MTHTFKVSEIIDRLENGHCRFNWSGIAHIYKPRLLIWWPLDPNDQTQGWFNLRLWMDTCTGFLRDSNAYFELELDLPISKLYEKVDEMLIMAKLADADINWEISKTNLCACECRKDQGYFVFQTTTLPGESLWKIRHELIDKCVFSNDILVCRKNFPSL